MATCRVSLVYLTVLGALVTGGKPSGRMSRMGVIQNLANCPDEDLKVQFENIVVDQSESLVQIMNGRIRVTEDVENGQADVSLTRCPSANSRDSCEHAAQLKIGPFCPRLDENQEMYGVFLKKITPEFKCPIKSGLYNITEAPVQTDNMDIAILKNGFYEARFTVNEGRRTVMCFTAELVISPNKSKG